MAKRSKQMGFIKRYTASCYIMHTSNYTRHSNNRKAARINKRQGEKVIRSRLYRETIEAYNDYVGDNHR